MKVCDLGYLSSFRGQIWDWDMERRVSEGKLRDCEFEARN